MCIKSETYAHIQSKHFAKDILQTWDLPASKVSVLRHTSFKCKGGCPVPNTQFRNVRLGRRVGKSNVSLATDDIRTRHAYTAQGAWLYSTRAWLYRTKYKLYTKGRECNTKGLIIQHRGLIIHTKVRFWSGVRLERRAGKCSGFAKDVLQKWESPASKVSISPETSFKSQTCPRQK